MKDTSGKVILSLLVGATAGAVAGLLLAPETGEATRSGLKKSASKWSDDLSKLLKAGLSNLDTAKAADTTDTTDQSAADELLKSMGSTGPTRSEANFPEDIDSDYDGIGGEARHSTGYGKGF